MANIKQTQEPVEITTILSNDYVEKHSLEWWGLLVHFILNPEKNFIEKITKQEEIKIRNMVNKESLKLRGLIQQQIFSVHTKNEAELLVRNYHAALTMMLGQAFDNMANLPVKKGAASEITAVLIRFFEELISLIKV